jgi:hypothetical protein
MNMESKSGSYYNNNNDNSSDIWGDGDYDDDNDDCYLYCVRPSFETQVQWQAVVNMVNGPLYSLKGKLFCNQLLCSLGDGEVFSPLNW